MYPFYLFLICINGNSVCFNLCHGTGYRAEKVPFFTLLTTEGATSLFGFFFFFSLFFFFNGRLAPVGRKCSPFKDGPLLSGLTKVPSDLTRFWVELLICFPPGHIPLYFFIQMNYGNRMKVSGGSGLYPMTSRIP